MTDFRVSEEILAQLRNAEQVWKCHKVHFYMSLSWKLFYDSIMIAIKTYLKEWHDIFSLLDHKDRDDECEWFFHPATTSRTKVKKAHILQGCQITRLRIVLRKTKFSCY